MAAAAAAVVRKEYVGVRLPVLLLLVKDAVEVAAVTSCGWLLTGGVFFEKKDEVGELRSGDSEDGMTATVIPLPPA